ncbi:MAG TPA: hypothetical protein VGC55_18885 [Dokdonella sp.]
MNVPGPAGPSPARSRTARTDQAAPHRRAQRGGDAWYAQPVLWLGLVIFAASLAGCVWMIMLGARHADLPLPTAGGEVMKMPLARPAPRDPARPPR